MIVDIVPLPSQLRPHHLAGRSVVVIDTLRASTTIAAALAAGAREVHVFETVESARAAAAAAGGRVLLAGERGCVKVAGFDLGNSPREMTPAAVAGRTIFMTTTNGTRAILSAAGAAEILVASLVNQSDTAAHLKREGRDVTCLCAGTGGERAPEDELAAEALRLALVSHQPPATPANLREMLAATAGGRNVIAAGLADDIDYAAFTDRLNVVCGATDAGALNVIRRISARA